MTGQPMSWQIVFNHSGGGGGGGGVLVSIEFMLAVLA